VKKTHLKVVDSNKTFDVIFKVKRHKILSVLKEETLKEYTGKEVKPILGLMRVPLAGSFYIGLAGRYTVEVHKDYIQYVGGETLVLGNLLFKLDMSAEDFEGGPASNDWLVSLNFEKQLMDIWDHKIKTEYALDEVASA